MQSLWQPHLYVQENPLGVQFVRQSRSTIEHAAYPSREVIRLKSPTSTPQKLLSIKPLLQFCLRPFEGAVIQEFAQEGHRHRAGAEIEATVLILVA